MGGFLEENVMPAFLVESSKVYETDINRALAFGTFRDYAEAPQQEGLYLIINTYLGRFYIGSAANLRKRIRTHQSKLRAGTHENKALQRDYLAHGEECIMYAVIAITEPGTVEKHERAAIGISNHRNLYNSAGANWKLRDCGHYI